MSAVPPPYTPQTDFATEAQQPIVAAGLPGSELDQEFGNIATTVSAIRSRLGQIQRDDGALLNGVVTFESLDNEILQFAVSGSVNLRGAWQPNTLYTFNGTKADVFTYAQQTRIVAVTYTSCASFGATDEANTGVLGTPPNIGNIYRKNFTGNGSTTAFTLDVEPVTGTNLHVYVAGLLKNPATDYTLAGRVVTFTAAPANAAVIITEVGVVSEIDITTVGDGVITESKLAFGSVTADKIGVSAVIAAKLATGAVTTAKLADAAVTTAKLENGSVTADKLATSSVTEGKIATGSVTADKIGGGAVTTAAIATGNVATGSLADNAVTTAKLADSNVTTAKILDSNVTTAKLADSSITTAKITDASITPAKLSGAQTGSAPIFGIRAFANVDGLTNANLTGTYSQSGTVCTVTVTAHGLRVGHSVYCNFTSGTATPADFTVATVVDANNFTVTRSSATTSGAVTLNFVTIIASGNIASVSKNATGDLGINFTTAMPSATYAVLGTTIGASNALGAGSINTKGNAAGSFIGPCYRKTVDTLTVLTSYTVNGFQYDMKEFYIAILG